METEEPNYSIMKITRKIHAHLLLCLLVAAFTACNDKDEVQQPTQRPVILTGEVFSIGSDVSSVWSGGQTVGVYMLKNGTQEIVNNYANLKYLADNRGATGYLVPADNVPMYLPEDGSKVDIRAYYPYTAEATAGYTRTGKPHTLEVMIDEKTKPDGFLYSQNGNGISIEQTHATLQLISILAAVKINFICTVTGARSISAQLLNMPSRGTFDLIGGQFISYDASRSNVLPMTGSVTQNTGSVNFEMQVVVLPGKVDENCKLAVSIYDTKGEMLKTYTPIDLHEILELQDKQLPENTQYDVAAQLTDNDNIETQLIGTSSICILNWTGGEEDPEGGIARPNSK